MICRKCGHSSGMHDESGCVALSCPCNEYVPTQAIAPPSVQPPRLPLNVKRIISPFEVKPQSSLRR